MPAHLGDRWQLTPVDDPHGRVIRDEDFRRYGVGIE